MIFSYRNGKLITEDEMLVTTDETKQHIYEIKINDEVVRLDCLPHFELEENTIFFFQQGMYLYLISFDKYTGSRYIAYIVEQTVDHNKMKIQNIDSYTVVSNNEWLLRYCVPSKVDESKNVLVGMKAILEHVKFMPEKEKQYLLNKIEEFFANDEKQEPVVIRKPVTLDKPTSYEKIIGGRAGTQVVYDDKMFNSVTAFLKEYNINHSTYEKAKNNGMSLDEIVERYSRINRKATDNKTSVKLPMIINGETFHTLSSIRAKYKINAATMRRAIAQGMPMEHIVLKYANATTRQKYSHSLIELPFEYKGEKFSSVSAFSRRYHMNPSSTERGLEMGLPLDEIVKRYANKAGINGGNKHIAKINTTPREVVCNGVTYPSVNNFLQENNLTSPAIMALKTGMPPEEVVAKFKKKTNDRRGRQPNTYEYAGQQLTLKEMSELSGIAISTIKSRLAMGWTVEKTMETPTDNK